MDLVIIDDRVRVRQTKEQAQFEEFVEVMNRRLLIARTVRYDVGGAE